MAPGRNEIGKTLKQRRLMLEQGSLFHAPDKSYLCELGFVRELYPLP